MFDILSRILSKAEVEGKIHDIKVDRTSPTISHLMYVDDLTIYCKATVEEAKELAAFLNRFSSWFRQVKNLSKSSIRFSRNTRQELKASILNRLGMVECTHKSKYLGLPFYRYSSKFQAFRDIIDKVDSKLAGWKSKVMSFASRSTLIKSTI